MTHSYFIKCDTLNHYMNENKDSRTADSEQKKTSFLIFFFNEILTRQYNEPNKD